MMRMVLFFVVCFSRLVALTHAEDKSPPASVKAPKLRAEFLHREKQDQEVREVLMEWMKRHGASGVGEKPGPSQEQMAEFQKAAAEMKQVDEANTKWLKSIVEKHGWPTISLVGKDGAKAAWLLVQHADADAKFQRRCLDLMLKLPKGEVSQSDLAYLTDRVLLSEGKKQIYGTQFLSIEGKWQPRPIEDVENVDKLRAKEDFRRSPSIAN